MHTYRVETPSMGIDEEDTKDNNPRTSRLDKRQETRRDCRDLPPISTLFQLFHGFIPGRCPRADATGIFWQLLLLVTLTINRSSPAHRRDDNSVFLYRLNLGEPVNVMYGIPILAQVLAVGRMHGLGLVASHPSLVACVEAQLEAPLWRNFPGEWRESRLESM